VPLAPEHALRERRRQLDHRDLRAVEHPKAHDRRGARRRQPRRNVQVRLAHGGQPLDVLLRREPAVAVGGRRGDVERAQERQPPRAAAVVPGEHDRRLRQELLVRRVVRGGRLQKRVGRRLVRERQVHVHLGHLVDRVEQPRRAPEAVGRRGERVVVRLQAEHRALLLLLHLRLAGGDHLRRVQVQHLRGRDPDVAVADRELDRRVDIDRAALGRAEYPILEHHLLDRAGDRARGLQDRPGIGVARDEVDGLAAGDALEQLVERLRIAALSDHVAGEEHAVVVEGADLAQERRLLIAEPLAREVRDVQYPVALEVSREADQRDLLLVDGDVRALQKHDADDQKPGDDQERRPERKMDLAPEQPQAARALSRSRAGKQPLEKRAPLPPLLFGRRPAPALLFLLRGAAGAAPPAQGSVLLVPVQRELVFVFSAADVGYRRTDFVIAHGTTPSIKVSLAIRLRIAGRRAVYGIGAPTNEMNTSIINPNRISGKSSGNML